MTLNLMIVAPWGHWLASDFRTCKVRNGHMTPREDLWSPKYVSLTTSDATLALTYTGAAEATAIRPDFGFPLDQCPDIQTGSGELQTVPVSEWVTWVLHGETRTLDQAVHHIASVAPTVRSLRTMHHVFSGVAFANRDGAWFVQIANLDLRPGEDIRSSGWFERPPRTYYDVYGRNILSVDDAFAGAAWTGARAISDTRWTLLQHIAKRRPRNPDDYMNLLAMINAEVAAKEPCVSPACTVTYLDPKRTNSRSRLYENGQKPPAVFLYAPIGNVWGIDLTQQSRSFLRQTLRERSEHEAGQRDQTTGDHQDSVTP